ncbi:MAG: LCP family protein, partial [Anaerolineae bacterium]|nr:LCP family protein [Anaerolineae bacterium]
IAARHRRSSVPTLVVGLLVLLLVVIGVVVVAFLLSWVRGSIAMPGISPGLPGDTQPSENVSYGFGQLLPTWAGTDRVTVLVLGVDERSQETGPWRTDTIMLLTLDPVSRQAGVLSIPRDLWVPIPGYSDGRINTAHFLGDLYNYPGGGPALSAETVEYNLGVPIDYTVRVNFQAFVVMVDQIGGIDVYVETTIDDPLYPDYNYGYDPLHIGAGWHHFDGEMALKYARTRHTSSDFDRARRQQQVAMAILDRVTSYELLPELARAAPELYKTLSSSVLTDMALDQMLALGNLAIDVDREAIRFGVIDQTCTQPWLTPEGAQVLVPLRDCMRELRDYVFEAIPVETTTGEEIVTLPTPTPEVATVAVLNGTARAGLAGSAADYLRAQGFDVVHVGNADRQDYASTLVVINHDKPVTTSGVVSSLSLQPTAVVQGQDTESTHDIVVVLGQDFELPQS